MSIYIHNLIFRIEQRMFWKRRIIEDADVDCRLCNTAIRAFLCISDVCRGIIAIRCRSAMPNVKIRLKCKKSYRIITDTRLKSLTKCAILNKETEYIKTSTTEMEDSDEPFFGSRFYSDRNDCEGR